MSISRHLSTCRAARRSLILSHSAIARTSSHDRRLRNQKENTMIKPQVKPVPDGMHTVTPHLTCAGAADAIEFYKKAFNATEMGRLSGSQGKLIHASIRIGDSVV